MVFDVASSAFTPHCNMLRALKTNNQSILLFVDTPLSVSCRIVLHCACNFIKQGVVSIPRAVDGTHIFSFQLNRYLRSIWFPQIACSLDRCCQDNKSASSAKRALPCMPTSLQGFGGLS